jgi:hypothetical protein
VSTIRRLTSWFVVHEEDALAQTSADRDRAVREALHAEVQVRDLCEALDAAEDLLRQLDRKTAHYRLGWQMGAPFVEYDDGPIDPVALSHPAFG